MKFFMSFIIALTFIFNLSVDHSYACSCAEFDSVQEELERSSVVFSGKAVEAFDKNKNNQVQSSADPIAVKFEVGTAWKGINETEVIVYTERDSASCGYEFSMDTEYLVYAGKADGELRVSFCSRTAPLTSAGEDLEELGKGEQPTETVHLNTSELSSESSSDHRQIYLLMLITVGIGMLLSIGYIVWLRRKRG